MFMKDNISYAKRNLIDSIWKEANLEGIGVTFPQTQEIVEGRTVAGLTIKETMTINNLKHAWQFLFDSIDYPLDMQWISQLHYEIGCNDVVLFPGERRESVVTIGGTDWRPDIPSYESFKDALSEVLAIQDPVDRALEAFCVVARTQYFNDGNKRTAQLVANKILIENGCGVLAVPKVSLEEFADRLLKYYETKDTADLKQFLRDNALDNPDLKPSKERFVPNRERFVSKSEPSLRETAEECRSASEMLNKDTESHAQNLNVR